MDRKKNYVAFDCGNSSIRVVSGLYDGNRIELKRVHQVHNGAVYVNGLYYWDILYIFKELQDGLKKAALKYGPVESVGISTWGIDFGLIGKSEQLLGNPLCYRNSLGEMALDGLTQAERDDIFMATGILDHPMNSLYQLLGIKTALPEYFQQAEQLLLIPDLLAWLFTGTKCAEPTIASTTQMMNMATGDYADEVLDRFGLQRSLLPPLTRHGTVYGYLKPEIAQTLRVNECPFVSVPSHDTASAVVAVPAMENDFLFISSGTWSLIGTELQEPIIHRDVYKEGFANEGGVFGTITLLKNSTGMHILQNIKKEMETSGRQYSWDEIVMMAKSCAQSVPLFDPNDSCFFNPPHMSAAIGDYTRKELTPEEVLASAYLSLACSYRQSIEKIERLCGKRYPVIYIVGGGCRNDYLNQITADITGRSVVAGPEEATSLGNIGIQLKKDQPGLTLRQIRQTIKASIEPRSFIPEIGQKTMDEMAACYSEYEVLFTGGDNKRR